MSNRVCTEGINNPVCNNILTYRSQDRIKKVLCTSPEVHVVRQLRAKDWNIGDWAGKSDGQGTVQSAREKSYIADTWSKLRVC